MRSAKSFAECILSGTQPNASETTLGKTTALGIPISLPSVGKKTTRQTRKKHSAKQRHSAKNRHADIHQLVCRPLGVCRVSVSRSKFAECFPLALGKEIILPSVFFGTRQINKFFSFLALKLFYYPHTTCGTLC